MYVFHASVFVLKDNDFIRIMKSYLYILMVYKSLVILNIMASHFKVT